MDCSIVQIDSVRGVSFSDIDECLEGIANCSQICNNTYGSYQCLCELGYMLNEEDNVTCNLSKTPVLQ